VVDTGDEEDNPHGISKCGRSTDVFAYSDC